MLFTRLRIKNLYSFQDSELDFTFPKKPVNSTISGEHPTERPNINVKRFCIFTGGNASGKTAIGKILCDVQNLISRGSAANWVYTGICDPEQPAEIHVELISTSNNWFHKFVFIFNKSESLIDGIPTDIEYASVYITKSDYISSLRTKIDNIIINKKPNSTNEKYKSSKNFISFRNELPESFSIFENDGWYYQLAQNTSSSLKEFDDIIKEDILNKILKTFDVSILHVEKAISSETKKALGYSVQFKNKDMILIEPDGSISQNKSDRLSRGTYDAIKVAVFLSRIIQDKDLENFSSTYFLDEAMAYAHSGLELAMINLIIDKLRPDSQFFYTTHNQDVLQLNIPTHSHFFIRKDENGSHVIQAEHMLKKNDRPLKSIINNDIAGILPDTSTLEDMLWDE